MAEGEGTSFSVGFLELLALTFIVLKLTKVIAWSWLWVLAPVWIPVILIVVVATCIGIAAARR